MVVERKSRRPGEVLNSCANESRVSSSLDNSKAEAEQLRRTEVLMNEYSLPWNVDDGKPPFPSMELNPCAVRWEPANLEDFIRQYGEEFKRFKNFGTDARFL